MPPEAIRLPIECEPDRRVVGKIVSDLLPRLAEHSRRTAEHSRRTRDLAVGVARRLGLGPEGIRTVCYAALLHDVGKLAVARPILDKPAELSEREREIVRLHPEVAVEMLAHVDGFEEVRAAISSHHERFDGRGYPAGLAGSDIPAEARLIFAADAYDAMTGDQPYRKALSHARAVEQLDLGAGWQFDSEMVEALKAVLDDA